MMTPRTTSRCRAGLWLNFEATRAFFCVPHSKISASFRRFIVENVNVIHIGVVYGCRHINLVRVVDYVGQPDNGCDIGERFQISFIIMSFIIAFNDQVPFN